MKTRFNWPVWAGLLLSLFAFFSYPFLFVRFPITRDVPWANLLLFVIAFALLGVGLRNAWRTRKEDSEGQLKPARSSRIIASLAATLGVAVLGFFLFATFVASRWLPASSAAPQVGQQAPDFSLPDTNGKTVSLAELVSQPQNGKPTKGALLIFYRGYW